MGDIQTPDTPPAEAGPQVASDIAPTEPRMGQEMEPRMGQVVEYCLNVGIYPGLWRPALVIRSVGAGCAQLAVLTDFANDGLPCPLWAPGATRGDGPGQWREQTEP